MIILDATYYKLFRIFKKDNSVKTVILVIQSIFAIILLIYIRKKLGLNNFFLGKANLYSTLAIVFFAITFGIFNELYYSEKRIKSIFKKYDKNGNNTE